MKVAGKIAVVSGGASGIGQAVANAFIERGGRVAIFDLNEAAGQAMTKSLGSNAIFENVNVADELSVNAAIAKTMASLGAIHVCVNCAGIGSASKTASRDRATAQIKHFPIDVFNKTIQINLVGTFRCIAKSAAGMLALEAMEHGERVPRERGVRENVHSPEIEETLRHDGDLRRKDGGARS